jgi:hypothetical protein
MEMAFRPVEPIARAVSTRIPIEIGTASLPVRHRGPGMPLSALSPELEISAAMT